MLPHFETLRGEIKTDVLIIGGGIAGILCAYFLQKEGVDYSGHMPECYVAAGFHKWGMTGAMTAAGILTDMILGKENPYAEVFSPSRHMMKQQLFLNGCEALVNLLTISKKRCPHLGCALKWNPQEHSWDCPCHGSGFAQDGTVLDNPANGNLKKH